LIRLLRRDGWTDVRRTNHGIAFTKTIEGRKRLTLVPDKRSVLPAGTLAAILGPKQSGMGRAGLARLIERHGLK
jgi:hypothetical protein